MAAKVEEEPMTKAVTIEAIEASAVDVFCREGFDRASLRDIAQEAGVPLSSIHTYFRSKADLYLQVCRRLFDIVDGNRLALFEKAGKMGGPIPLEQIVHCLVAPMILPRYRHIPGFEKVTQIIRTWLDTTTYLEADPQFRDSLRKSVEFWIRSLRESCPGLDGEGGKLAYCLISSALFQWEANHHYLDRVLGLQGEGDAQRQCDKLVQFIAGGIRSLAGQADDAA
jgi:AcrR family transcriptional regulator